VGEIYLHNDVFAIPSSYGQTINNREYFRGINIKNGELLWEREGNFSHYQLDSTSGHLYGYAHGIYEVADMRSGQKLINKKNAK